MRKIYCFPPPPPTQHWERGVFHSTCIVYSISPAYEIVLNAARFDDFIDTQNKGVSVIYEVGSPK